LFWEIQYKMYPITSLVTLKANGLSLITSLSYKTIICQKSVFYETIQHIQNVNYFETHAHY